MAICILAVSLSACQPGPAAPSTQKLEQDRAAILSQSRLLSESYIAGDIQTLVGIYTEDGVAAPGGRDFLQGPAALTRYWNLPEGRTVLRHETTTEELVLNGDYAYDRGYYSGQSAQDGEPLAPFRGAYLIVWERGSDGTWRIAVDMWYGLST